MDSEVQWRCEPAVLASVCQEAEGCVALCLHDAPDATRPPPPGTQVQLLDPSPPEPPVDLAGRLEWENKHHLKGLILNSLPFSFLNKKTNGAHRLCVITPIATLHLLYAHVLPYSI